MYDVESLISTAEVTPTKRPISRVLSRGLAVALVALLAILLVEVLIEGWLTTVLGTSHIDASGNAVLDLVTWPKTVKNTAYISLLVLGAAKLVIDRRLSVLRTKVDLALVVLGLILVVAGLVAGSSTLLIGQALFVYFRGVIVFYAWRALNPRWPLIRRFIWVFGTIVSIYAAIAIWQMIVGYKTYSMLGWVDMTWARIDRAHALMTHPNDLGHVTGLLLLGLLAWFVGSPKVKLRWWVLFVIVATGLAATQSRESVIGVLLGAILIAILRRGRYRRIAVASVLVLLMAAVPLLVSPSNRAEWARRLNGVAGAFEVPSGQEAEAEAKADVKCDENSAECASTEVPPREIRVLYFQQGLRLWLHSPVLGYGVGQFGGIVAFRDDPNWNLDPRFGPDGFDRHGFKAKTVDSFWLHLAVEAGALGAIAYAVWTWLMALPFMRRARRQEADHGAASAATFWAPAALVFGALIAVFAPSLEDPLFPPLMFSVIGIGWVLCGFDAGSRAKDAVASTAEGEAPVDSIRQPVSSSATDNAEKPPTSLE